MADTSSEPAFSESRPRIAVVTALAGDRDDLKDPEVRFESADYIAFVDDPTKHPSAVWDVRTLPTGWSLDEKYEARRHAKLPKILPDLVLPTYDFTVWVDANIDLTVDPFEMCRRFLIEPSADLAAFPHRDRNCAYAELLMARIAKVDTKRNLHLIRREYRQHRIQRRGGLFELPFILRRHGELSTRFGLCWWESICRHSSRDQLSFPIAVSKTGLVVESIVPGIVWRNPYMKKRVHRNQAPERHTFTGRIRQRLIRRFIPSLHECRSERLKDL